MLNLRALALCPKLAYPPIASQLNPSALYRHRGGVLLVPNISTRRAYNFLERHTIKNVKIITIVSRLL
jgi:hypothetical protein